VTIADTDRCCAAASRRRGEELVLPAGPILNRLSHVRGLNAFGSGEVGDGAGELEDTVESAGPCGELELGHRCAHQTHPGVVQFAVSAHVGGPHIGVGGGVTAEAFALNLARAGDSGLNCLGTFTQSCVGQLHMIHTRDFDVAKRVDAVKQWAADPFLVTGDRARRAGALFD